jgi:uncharacterized damage-inducible protein DinB
MWAQGPNAFAQMWLQHCREHWADTKEYTLAVFDAMPADGIDFKPTPVQQPFGTMMAHLGSANVVYFRAFGLVPDPPARETKTGDREAVRRYLVATFDYAAAVLAKLTQKDLERTDLNLFPKAKPHSGIDVFLRAYMHSAHHRGQATSYLRGKGIAPPPWKFEPSAG